MLQIKDIPRNIHKKFIGQEEIGFNDFIDAYQSSGFEYEKVDMKASDFKSHLIKELLH